MVEERREKAWGVGGLVMGMGMGGGELGACKGGGEPVGRTTVAIF